MVCTKCWLSRKREMNMEQPLSLLRQHPYAFEFFNNLPVVIL
jgi:hypothetical protein